MPTITPGDKKAFVPGDVISEYTDLRPTYIVIGHGEWDALKAKNRSASDFPAIRINDLHVTWIDSSCFQLVGHMSPVNLQSDIKFVLDNL